MILGGEQEYTIAGFGNDVLLLKLQDAFGWLPCGGKLYADIQQYIEFAGPECISVKDALRYEKAGERITWRAVEKQMKHLSHECGVLKTSGDAYDHLWTKGSHENYLITKHLLGILHGGNLAPARWMLTFLVTRQIFAGAGLLHLSPDGKRCTFAISQRANCIGKSISVTTTHALERGIINLKNEPHCSGNRARLHLIIGDLNRCDWSIFLKLGTTVMLLEFLEDCATHDLMGSPWEFTDSIKDLDVRDPVMALWMVSRDLSLRVTGLFVGAAKTAWEVQDLFWHTLNYWYHGFRKEERGADQEYEFILLHWRIVLDQLKRDPMNLVGTLDWPTKLAGIEQILEGPLVKGQRNYGLILPHGGLVEEMVSWDYLWSSLDPDTSLFEEALRIGLIKRLISEGEIRSAINRPPRKTRAFFRGNAVREFARHFKQGNVLRPERSRSSWGDVIVQSSYWDIVTIQVAGKIFKLAIPDPDQDYRESLQRVREFIDSLPVADKQ